MAKFLVGLDPDADSEPVLQLAIKHARVLDAGIHLVASLPGGDETTAERIEAVESKLARVESEVKSAGLPCESHLLVHGVTAGEDLVAFAREHGIDEMYVSVRKKSQMEKIVFGSTARYVILKAPCPVMTTK